MVRAVELHLELKLGGARHKAPRARLAQSVEHETLNLGVVGSSPTSGVLHPPSECPLDAPFHLALGAHFFPRAGAYEFSDTHSYQAFQWGLGILPNSPGCCCLPACLPACLAACLSSSLMVRAKIM